MKLKSLKLALNCVDLVLGKNKKKYNPLINMIIEAKIDIEGCIKIVEEQIEDFKKADIVDALQSCLTVPVIIDLPDRGYLKKDDPLNPYLRAEKIEKEEKAKRSNI